MFRFRQTKFLDFEKQNFLDFEKQKFLDFENPYLSGIQKKLQIDCRKCVQYIRAMRGSLRAKESYFLIKRAHTIIL